MSEFIEYINKQLAIYEMLQITRRQIIATEKTLTVSTLFLMLYITGFVYFACCQSLVVIMFAVGIIYWMCAVDNDYTALKKYQTNMNRYNNMLLNLEP